MKGLFWYCFIVLSLISGSALAQKPIKINLPDAVAKHQVEVINRELTILSDPRRPAIRLSKAFGEGLAWINGVEFSNGTIEFDVRGEDVKQHSFVGIAFNGQNDTTYDAVYLRPFHFRAQDSVSQYRMIQYISLPEYTWRKIRAEYPGKFENKVASDLDPNGWVHMRVDVKDDTVAVYVNENPSPCLVVQKVTGAHSGRIGFYVADTSGGDFANLSVRHER